jgi:hypothetical protein
MNKFKFLKTKSDTTTSTTSLYSSISSSSSIDSGHQQLSHNRQPFNQHSIQIPKGLSKFISTSSPSLSSITIPTTTTTAINSIFGTTSTPSFDFTKTILIERFDVKEQMLHFELYSTSSWYNHLILKLPFQIRKKFILAKIGVRTYSSSGETMDGIIANIFGDRVDNGMENNNDYEADSYSNILNIQNNNIHNNNNDNSNNNNNNNNNHSNSNEQSSEGRPISLLQSSGSTTTSAATSKFTTTTAFDQSPTRSTTATATATTTTTTTRSHNNIRLSSNSNTRIKSEPTSTVSSPHFKIGVFVYMWIKPNFQGFNIGDFLLTTVFQYCRKRGDQYMLLVHDDIRKGKLINYYKNRGFVPIFDFIDQGMICKINVN